MEAPPDAPIPSSAPDAGPSPQIKRAHQACLHCRKRKSRCLLDAGGVPCLRCKREGLDCVLGGSKRGGRRERGKKQHLPPLRSVTTYDEESAGFHGLGNVGTTPWTITGPGEAAQNGRESEFCPPSESSVSEETPLDNMQNPSDALGILARVAEKSSGQDATSDGNPITTSTSLRHDSRTLPQKSSYHLLNDRTLTVPTICHLLLRYQQNYHPYCPLAPSHVFDTSRLAATVEKERHLLTAILVISSKDLVEEPHIFTACTEYMKSLVSDLAAGGDADLEAVAALLLLAEWAPYTQRRSGKVGKGEEDKESWMHVGMALRIAYYLGLDRYSFRIPNEAKDPNHHQKRLIWTAAYIMDRHVSIRIGKAFWSRGPGPLTTLRREDYPSLLPKSPNEEDYASIFQANLELTQLFSSIHDVLYSNLGTGVRSHLDGSYIKFIDDFRAAIYGWKSIWGTLTCSPPLKSCQLLAYDYLRLYTNAFAFQATVRRAMPPVGTSHSDSTTSSKPAMQAPQPVFTNNVGAVGDARFIFEGLDAAKAILTTVNNFVDPEKTLRFLPLRYYLYLVYAGVFLYRARCAGVVSGDEDFAIRAMVNETVARLQRSSVAAGNPIIQHPGSRYSQLLKLLWDKVPRKDRAGRRAYRHPGTHIANNIHTSNGFQDQTTHLQSPSDMGSSSSYGTPANTEHMGDFGWTDLNAISDFAINGAGAANVGDDAAFWNGFLPLDMGWPVGDTGLGLDSGAFMSDELRMNF